MITSPNTFVATPNAGLYLGANVKFGDVEIETGNLDSSKLEVTEKTKLIVPVHYSGQPVDLKEFSEIAEENDIKLIEDGAHALGATYENKKIGSLKYSEMAMFSFHPVKHITTGEGGIIVTNDCEYYERLQLFRAHGITKNNLVNESSGDWYYEMQELGFNYRITDIQCALGVSQLKKLDSFIKVRRSIAKIYDEIFAGNPYFDVTVEKENRESSYHLYPILLKEKFDRHKKEIFSKLRQEGLGVQVHYIPVYKQPYYQELGFGSELCPVCEEFYKREISIPMYPTLTGEGGIIVTNDEEYYERLQLFRSHGITKNNLVNESHGDWYYEMQYLGYNYRITDIQCALGISQLKKLDSFVKSRRKIGNLLIICIQFF